MQAMTSCKYKHEEASGLTDRDLIWINLEQRCPVHVKLPTTLSVSTAQGYKVTENISTLQQCSSVPADSSLQMEGDISECGLCFTPPQLNALIRSYICPLDSP